MLQCVGGGDGILIALLSFSPPLHQSAHLNESIKVVVVGANANTKICFALVSDFEFQSCVIVALVEQRRKSAVSS